MSEYENYYLDNPVYIMRNDEVYAHFNGEYLTVEDYSRNGVELTSKEAIELARAILKHYGEQ